ncbi:MAG TPA: MlaD family protein [Chitinophagaceae bacterium]|nr:MlaD family protein [Chitinophagaceae bacterium]
MIFKRSAVDGILGKIGDEALFFNSFVKNIFKGSFEFNEFFRQCYLIGYKTWPIVALTGTILGFVLTLQLLPTLKQFGAQTYVPAIVYANFKNVSGLQIGSFIRFAGINVGTVEDITIKNDTTVRVDMLLLQKVKPFIKADSKVSIASDGLMGDKLLQISPGSDTALLLKDGQLTSVDPLDMDELMKKISMIADNAENITGSLADIVGKVNNGEGSTGRLLNNDKFEKNMEATVKSAQQTVQKIGNAASGVSDNMDAVKHSILFRGYFRRKEKQRIQDSIKQAKTAADSIAHLKNARGNR